MQAPFSAPRDRRVASRGRFPGFGAYSPLPGPTNNACKGICAVENENALRAVLRPRRRQNFLKHLRLCLKWAGGPWSPRVPYCYCLRRASRSPHPSVNEAASRTVARRCFLYLNRHTPCQAQTSFVLKEPSGGTPSWDRNLEVLDPGSIGASP